jgi:hypothetical protein
MAKISLIGSKYIKVEEVINVIKIEPSFNLKILFLLKSTQKLHAIKKMSKRFKCPSVGYKSKHLTVNTLKEMNSYFSFGVYLLPYVFFKTIDAAVDKPANKLGIC